MFVTATYVFATRCVWYLHCWRKVFNKRQIKTKTRRQNKICPIAFTLFSVIFFGIFTPLENPDREKPVNNKCEIAAGPGHFNIKHKILSAWSGHKVERTSAHCRVLLHGERRITAWNMLKHTYIQRMYRRNKGRYGKEKIVCCTIKNILCNTSLSLGIRDIILAWHIEPTETFICESWTGNKLGQNVVLQKNDDNTRRAKYVIQCFWRDSNTRQHSSHIRTRQRHTDNIAHTSD